MMSIDLLSDEVLTDPYPFYARLREESPVCRAGLPTGLETWQVTRYEDVRRVLADRRFSHAEEALRQAGVFVGSEALFGPSMMTSDPPDHTRLRRLVSKAFTPRRVEELRPRMQKIVDGLIDAMASRSEVDLVSAFAFPLPVTVICELLGVPPQDRDDFRAWTRTMVIVPANQQERELVEHGARALERYLRQLVARRQSQVRHDLPDEMQPDLLSALIVARDEGGELSDRELVGTMNLLLFAGHETSANLIGNGMLALFRNPDQLQLLRKRPELLPAAIEELLRYEGPAQRGTFRVATEDVDVAGVTIPAGSVVMVMIASADRDPRQFANPERLDITRGSTEHVAFGHGIHYCLGAPLARMEGEIAFRTLLARFPNLALACAPEQVQRGPRSIFVRGVVSLPVRLAAL